MNRISTLKFSESGVRGIVGEGLTARLAADLGAAFGFYQGGGRIVVGRDTRSTGGMFEQAVTAGLLAAGCEVLRVGVIPTPTLQYTVKSIEAAGGIAITASHNPPQWNALKFIGGAGTFLSPGEAAGLFDLYNQGNLPYRAESDYRGIRVLPDAFSLHEKRIFEVIDVEAVRKKKFRVAVDCVNGVGAVFSAGFLQRLGCEVFAINDRPDGNFARSPEPLPENLGALCRAVRENGCDVGFGQDPDGDRLTVVTEKGVALSTHYTVALAVDQVLDGGDPGPVVANVQTSRLVEMIAESYGCSFYSAPVGEINVVEKMIEVDGVIGGEGNCRRGHLPAGSPGAGQFRRDGADSRAARVFGAEALGNRGGFSADREFVVPFRCSADPFPRGSGRTDPPLPVVCSDDLRRTAVRPAGGTRARAFVQHRADSAAQRRVREPPGSRSAAGSLQG